MGPRRFTTSWAPSGVEDGDSAAAFAEVASYRRAEARRALGFFGHSMAASLLRRGVERGEAEKRNSDCGGGQEGEGEGEGSARAFIGRG